jgi:DNA-binding NarL/FixJ family response regulator
MRNDLIRIGIVDDHTLFRDGLVNLLEEFTEVVVVFKAKDGIGMQQVLDAGNPPDIILMDINMPNMDGHEATAWVKARFPLVHILALSMYEDDLNIIKMLKKGADGYVLKECNASELMQAITSIMRNGYYLNELVSGKLMNSIREEQGEGTARQLTARELEFLELCCTELTYKEIADRMNVSPRTVDGYRDALFEKLSIKSRTGLVLYAIKNQVYKIV